MLISMLPFIVQSLKKLSSVSRMTLKPACRPAFVVRWMCVAWAWRGCCSIHVRATDLAALRVSEVAVVDVPCQGVGAQHLVALLVAHRLVVGLIQGDPQLHILTQLRVAQPGVCSKRLGSLPAQDTHRQPPFWFGCFGDTQEHLLWSTTSWLWH